MKIIQSLLLVAILLVLINMRIAVEKWGVELSMTKITTVQHIYNYKVDAYGTVQLNDKLIGLSYK